MYLPEAVTSIATQLIPPITMEPQKECRLPNLQQQNTDCLTHFTQQTATQIQHTCTILENLMFEQLHCFIKGRFSEVSESPLLSHFNAT